MGWLLMSARGGDPRKGATGLGHHLRGRLPGAWLVMMVLPLCWSLTWFALLAPPALAQRWDADQWLAPGGVSMEADWRDAPGLLPDGGDSDQRSRQLHWPETARDARGDLWSAVPQTGNFRFRPDASLQTWQGGAGDRGRGGLTTEGAASGALYERGYEQPGGGFRPASEAPFDLNPNEQYLFRPLEAADRARRRDDAMWRQTSEPDAGAVPRGMDADSDPLPTLFDQMRPDAPRWP